MARSFVVFVFLCWCHAGRLANCEEGLPLEKTEKLIKMAGTRQPIVISTWNFSDANIRGWQILEEGGSALDAVEEGCTKCEELQCDFTVGFGGSPDETGETTLDSMIMDGNTMNVGAVGCLRRIKSAIRVARKVLDHTKHSLLVGEKATQFAVSLGFKEESLTTQHSTQLWETWKANGCQPNFWQNVQPNPEQFCGPYIPGFNEKIHGNSVNWGEHNHDTIGMLAIDKEGNIAAGTSSNGANHKIPGRVGDSPIPGAGAYADSEVGAAAATGDGDVMMRLLPSHMIVESMRAGNSPSVAAEQAIKRIAGKYPEFMGAVIAVSREGQIGTACHGIASFPYVVSTSLGQGVLHNQPCVTMD